MSIFKKFLGREKEPDRLFVLSLDGVPHSFVQKAAESGLMPNLARLLGQGVLTRLAPVLPAVSTVAWATYMTGQNPGRHGIYGFMDRRPNPFGLYVPTSRELKAPTLWELVGGAGKRVGVMNVPLTFPPKQVHGFLVGCFLSPDLAGATFPVELAPRLMQADYRIDADTTLAGDPPAFLEDLNLTLSRRFEAAFSLMSSEPWDFFQLHVMSTDRLNHFFWGVGQDGEGGGNAFNDFYRRLDSYLGELTAALPAGCHFMMVSDHGFTAARGAVNLNQWLMQNGYLMFQRGGKRELKLMHAESRAYSLAPGRVYLNVEGREEHGKVAMGRDYEDLRQELIHRIGGLTHPETGEALVKKVHRREDLFKGSHLSRAPDLLVEAVDGYDLKANLNVDKLVDPADLRGVHTPGDAFFYLRGVKAQWEDEQVEHVDLAPTAMALLGLAVPPSMDGQSLV